MYLKYPNTCTGHECCTLFSHHKWTNLITAHFVKVSVYGIRGWFVQLLNIVSDGILRCQGIRGAEYVSRLASYLPLLQLAIETQPVTRNILRVTVRLTPDFTWLDRHHGNGGPLLFWVWVEDPDEACIYHSEVFALSKKGVSDASFTPTAFYDYKPSPLFSTRLSPHGRSPWSWSLPSPSTSRPPRSTSFDACRIGGWELKLSHLST